MGTNRLLQATRNTARFEVYSNVEIPLRNPDARLSVCSTSWDQSQKRLEDRSASKSSGVSHVSSWKEFLHTNASRLSLLVREQALQILV